MRRLLMVSLALWFSIAVACVRLQGAQEGSDSINGTWVGDFGPAVYDRNTISLELKWDGKKLTGTVKPETLMAACIDTLTGFRSRMPHLIPKRASSNSKRCI